FSLLYGAASSLFWISRRYSVRLACVSRLQFVAPSVLFTILDFLALYGVPLVHFAIPIRYAVGHVHYSGFSGAAQLFSTYSWIPRYVFRRLADFLCEPNSHPPRFLHNQPIPMPVGRSV